MQRAIRHPASASPADLLQLQRAAGNRAVASVLAGIGVQRKLTVGPADDRYEQEAERVSQQVVSSLGDSAGAAQRQSDDESEMTAPRVQRRLPPIASRALDDELRGAAPEVGDAGGEASASLERQIQGARHGGDRLDSALSRQLGNGFGADFSGVRVHTGAQADRLNRSIQAQAFTIGSDIFFRSGQYDPHSAGGRQLVAHELTHVVQQSGAVQRRPNVTVQGRLSADRISTKRKKLYLDFVRMKRLDPRFDRIILKQLKLNKLADLLGSGDTYGHWWTEIGDLNGDFPAGEWKAARSFGWYPKEGTGGHKGTFKGVPGQLNTKDDGIGAGMNDEHHGQVVDKSQMFHPVMELDDKEDYTAVRDRVTSQITSFAKSYSGLWQWKLGWGQNCHTFQQEMKKAVGIHNQRGDGWFKRPQSVQGIYDPITQKRQQKLERLKEADWQTRFAGRDFKLTQNLTVWAGQVNDVDKAEIELPAGTDVRLMDEQVFGSHIDAKSDTSHVEIVVRGPNYGQQYYTVVYGKLKEALPVLKEEDVPETDTPGFQLIDQQPQTNG